jgi:hypothetical protein
MRSWSAREILTPTDFRHGVPLGARRDQAVTTLSVIQRIDVIWRPYILTAVCRVD